MANDQKNHVTSALRKYAEKMAAEKEKAASGEGTPDRMTTADGQGGITTEKGTIPHDSGEDDVKTDQPADGATRNSNEEPGGGPDRMTTADGQGGITAEKGNVPTDSGEADVKADQPTDGDTRKSATVSDRVAKIRQALRKEAAPSDPPAQTDSKKKDEVPAGGSAQTKEAGSEDTAPKSSLSESLSQETLAKIASAVLSTDEGVQFAHDMIEKQAGEAAAREQIEAAITAAQAYDESEVIKSAALNQFDATLSQIDAGLTELGVGEAEAESILKQAAVHQQAINEFDHPLLKQAYAAGMDDAALLAAADESAGEEGVPPVDEAMPMGGEELSEEEIMALLQEMVASGEITEEDIAAALEAEGGAAPVGGEEVPMEEEIPAGV